MRVMNDDTIAAIATALGQGAIAVIRVSGKRSLEIADRVFRGGSTPSKAQPNTVHFGKIVTNGNEVVDQALLTIFREPKSYTGEDSIELSCHGGIQIARAVLECVLQSGARQAEPGEFTKRAFLNGKLDLSQAEAVADLISSRTRKAQQASLSQLRGTLSAEISRIRTRLLNLCSQSELQLDFLDEGIEISNAEEIKQEINQARSSILAFIQSYESSRILRNGFTVCIAGPPNVGKSTLFNALIRTDRSIVSEIPGTTRDFIEESIEINGILFKLIDTAGIRSSADPVESIGVSRSGEIMSASDAICLVSDNGSFETIGAQSVGKPTIFVHNKTDLSGTRSHRTKEHGEEHVFLSAKLDDGIGLLKSALVDVASASFGGLTDSVHVGNLRHVNALKSSMDSLDRAYSSIIASVPMEFVSMDIRTAANHLGEITGEFTTDEILNNIFSKFCIGK